MDRRRRPSAGFCAAGLLLAAFLPAANAEVGRDPASALDRAVSAAESSLRDGEVHAAERHYRSALLEGWLLLGTLDRLEGRLTAARDAFRNASSSAVDDRRALLPLALAHLQMGEAEQATGILTRLIRKNPKDTETRRLLAHALAASGLAEQAVRELEQGRLTAPDDLELAFHLAGGYLALKNVDRAAQIFAEIVRARPIPQTRVLIGRTYGESGVYDRARVELGAGLKQNPRVRHAHYYLGMLAVKQQGRAGLEDAIAEFRAELRVAPEDPLSNRELGAALVEAQRPAEALSALQIAARSGLPEARTLYYLGRSQLALELPSEAATSLKLALELAREQGANTPALRAIHIQLAQALRSLDTQEAAAHFAEAERLSAVGVDVEREQLARYMADVPEAAPTSGLPLIEDSPLAALPPAQRSEIARRVRAALARSYLNLGIMQVQSERFARAVELFEKAAQLDPDFPQLQSSLGVAYFNARQFDKATEPLTRALTAAPQQPGLKRMLAMAWLNTNAYDKAAELLKDDPELSANTSLQFAYGLALVKSDRAAEAERIFARLLAQHGDSAEVSVLLGQAHAQQGNYDAAIDSLKRALQIKAGVAEANATLGEIYLRQGQFAEAEQALRAELKEHPGHLETQQHLAIVLDSQQRPQEAVTLLRSVLQAKPDSANARYLLGKILLAQGEALEAVEHLEAAARLTPEDANIPYQLGRAYQKLGRTEQAQQQFDLFRQLKDKR